MADLTSLIRDDFQHAWNAQNLDGLLRLFTDDAVVEAPSPLPGRRDVYRGPELREFAEPLLPGFHVESRGFETTGGRVTWSSTIACDLFRQLGIDTLDATAAADVRDGRIAAFTVTFSPASFEKMGVAVNRIASLRIFDIFNTGAVDAADDLIAADVVDHEHFPGVESGRGGFKQIVGMMRAAFPDFHVTIDDMIAEGDRVAARITLRGTHQGPFLGVPPTGRPVVFQNIDVMRFADGQAVEHWAVSDRLGLLQQLGVIPPPAAEPPSGDGTGAAAHASGTVAAEPA